MSEQSLQRYNFISNHLSVLHAVNCSMKKSNRKCATQRKLHGYLKSRVHKK